METILTSILSEQDFIQMTIRVNYLIARKAIASNLFKRAKQLKYIKKSLNKHFKGSVVVCLVDLNKIVVGSRPTLSSIITNIIYNPLKINDKSVSFDLVYKDTSQVRASVNKAFVYFSSPLISLSC